MRQRRLKNEINVVPYIDVMLVLLVIFMVTAPMIDLPSVGKAATASVAPLEVSIKADQSLMLTDRAGDGKDVPVNRKELMNLIKAAQDKNPDQPVLIAGDKSVKYEAVLSVMDELQRAQIKRVGLLVQTGSK
jgi:biopolymer transport protein TolR